MTETIDTTTASPPSKRGRRLIKSLLLLALVIYGGICVAVFSLQRKILYPAPQPARAPAHAAGELLRPAATTGTAGAAFFMRAPDPGAPVVVHFHGNAEQLADGADLGAGLLAQGLSYYGIEYPGYGLLESQSATEQSLYAAAEGALQHLEQELEIPRAQTVLFGRSLGSGVASEMARRGFGGRLVLVSPYTSIVAMAKRVFPLLPARLLVRDRFDTLSKATEIQIPALVIHSDRDEVIPFDMGRKVAEALPDARFVPIEGRGHNDLFQGTKAFSEIVRFALDPSPTKELP